MRPFGIAVVLSFLIACSPNAPAPAPESLLVSSSQVATLEPYECRLDEDSYLTGCLRCSLSQSDGVYENTVINTTCEDMREYWEEVERTKTAKH